MQTYKNVNISIGEGFRIDFQVALIAYDTEPTVESIKIRYVIKDGEEYSIKEDELLEVEEAIEKQLFFYPKYSMFY